ncbi:nuclear transport factor 2 family protein [Azospirillum griseum]|nr:nuclear transport factor 2 family protein [Azospirillum griseum]
MADKLLTELAGYPAMTTALIEDTDPQAADKAAILALEDARQRAMIAADWGALADLLADDYLHIHTTGVIQTRQDLLDYVKGGLKFVAITRDHLRLRLFGDTAILTGDMVNTVLGPQGGDPIVVSSICTQVWLKRDGVWKEVSFQSTRPTPHAAPQRPSA